MPKGVHDNHARGARNGRWNGGRTVTSHGYVRVKVGKTHPLADPNGYAYEHHLVMCSAIGRLLERGEVVHHRNGDKQDNRFENLELTTRRAHAVHHDGERGRDQLGRFPADAGREEAA